MIKENIIKITMSVKVILNILIKHVRDLYRGRYQKLHDVHNNKKVIIMGNGPSLNELDISNIRREDYVFCCVNYFPIKTTLFEELKPEYICLLDPGFYRYTIEAEVEDKKALLNKLENVDWPMTVIVPCGYKLEINNDKLAYQGLNYFMLTDGIFTSLKYYLYNKNLANYGYQNVTLGALYYYITCNFKTIFLIGVDLSDFKFLYVDENNRVYVDSTHSYGTTRYYYDEMQECGVSEFYEILGCYHKMFVDFHEAQKYAEYKNIEVYNLSLLSYVDSFKKVAPYDIDKY